MLDTHWLKIHFSSVKEEIQRFFFLFCVSYLLHLDFVSKPQISEINASIHLVHMTCSWCHLPRPFQSSDWCVPSVLDVCVTLVYLYRAYITTCRVCSLWPFHLCTSNLHFMTLLPPSPGLPSDTKLSTRPSALSASLSTYVI